MHETISEWFILHLHGKEQRAKKHMVQQVKVLPIFSRTTRQKGKWSMPVPVETLDSEFEDGTPNFSSDFKEIYFTRCEAGKRESKGCIIMHSTRRGET
jgi:hypothetical protein